jgi:HPt (histidine-containing phosphotransfer) domain-containing protein
MNAVSDETDFGQLADDLAPDDLRNVLAVFVTDVKRLTAELDAAAAAENHAAFRRAAHGLAGAAGAVGATALAQTCQTAMVGRDPAPAQLRDTAAAVETLAATALTELADFLAHLADAPGNDR